MPSLVNPADSDRFAALHAWAAHVLRAPHIQLTALSGDAGFRRYFRVSGNPNTTRFPALLAVDAPPKSEDSPQFIAIAQTLARAGLTTPQIFFADTDNGFLLIEDFGDQLLSTQLAPDADFAQIYAAPLANLLKLQATPPAPALLPTYDETFLRRELQLFTEWFVEQLLGYTLTPDDAQLLENTFDALVLAACEQPQTWVHRDYHSRNLLLCDDDRLGIIDFQGALFGPITYDLVSLLKDCYWRLPPASVQHLARDFWTQLQAQGGISPDLHLDEFMRAFDLMGLQRHIKVLGIFARLHLRDGKSHYLQDLPRVLRYVREAAERYPETQAFAKWFDAHLMPLIEQQTWFTPNEENP